MEIERVEAKKEEVPAVAQLSPVVVVARGKTGNAGREKERSSTSEQLSVPLVSLEPEEGGVREGATAEQQQIEEEEVDGVEVREGQGSQQQVTEEEVGVEVRAATRAASDRDPREQNREKSEEEDEVVVVDDDMDVWLGVAPERPLPDASCQPLTETQGSEMAGGGSTPSPPSVRTFRPHRQSVLSMTVRIRIDALREILVDCLPPTGCWRPTLYLFSRQVYSGVRHTGACIPSLQYCLHVYVPCILESPTSKLYSAH